MLADINPVRKYAMQGSDPKSRTTLGPFTGGVESFDDFFGSKWSRLAIPTVVEPEYQPDELCFNRVDIELFLDFRAASFCFNGSVTKGYRRAVVKALSRILIHGTANVLCIFFRLVFIK
ncbi:hypothetical protein [Roseibium sp.]|uniref:hypothetical protein n=1 Tax=Roseibium sp. TaxID=1936156 RepID=UPI003262CDF8